MAKSTPEVTSNRWIQLDRVSIGSRIVGSDDSSGGSKAGEMQHQEIIEGAFLVDSQAKFSVHGTLADGDNFAGGWSNMGIGTSAPGSYRIYLKKLYVSAKPIDGVELQYGGIGIERGISSAIASYSNDAYIVGERILIDRPAALFFDTISVTKGYLGDLDLPEVGNRFRRLARSNYQQFLMEKNIEKRVAGSIDYTNQWGIKTVREAAHVRVSESRIFDAVQIDLYQRANGFSSAGFNLGAEKAITSRLSFMGGYAAIDWNYGDLNDDAFFKGNRVYAGAQLQVTKALGISSLLNYAVENDRFVSNSTHFHLAVKYDLLGAIARTGLFGGNHS